jgi:hypothetical protein
VIWDQRRTLTGAELEQTAHQPRGEVPLAWSVAVAAQFVCSSGL